MVEVLELVLLQAVVVVVGLTADCYLCLFPWLLLRHLESCPRVSKRKMLTDMKISESEIIIVT